MKNSIFNSFIAAAAFSLAFGLPNHVAAEQNSEQAAAAPCVRLVVASNLYQHSWGAQE